ncbi:MAG: biotin--[acetyl-CoA-carboxylase] ligase [Microthrixaceae bacterium]|nr:biotin--[acetyl-CoA-carboxylase] ligase [Microthrixaceae bacterium]
MDTGRAKGTVPGDRFSKREWVARTGSTNTDLLAVARAGGPEQVLVADEQTTGRGRLGRSWVAPPGASLLCSILLRPDIPAGEAGCLTMALGVAATDAVAEVAGCRLGLKWPNDLVSVAPGGDLKVSGMLSEAVLDGERLAAVVLGIGINVNWPDELPAELAATATSLRHLVGRDIDRHLLLEALLAAFETRLDEPATSLLEVYRKRCATLGRRVRIETTDGATEALAIDIDPDGALVVESASGVRRSVFAADIVHLRPLS